jgi:hypothetical protein
MINASVVRLNVLKSCGVVVQVKIKITLEQAIKAQRGSRGIALR